MKHILLISDNKPGHENISRGIIEEISRHNQVEVSVVYVKLRSKILKRCLRWLLNRSLDTKYYHHLIKLFYKDARWDQKRFDCIISTGGDTSFINIMLSKILNCPNIYCSSLRGLDNTLFNYIISIVHKGYQNEIVVDMAPLSLDLKYDNLAALKQSYHLLSDKKTWSVLIGGSTKEYLFSKDNFKEMIEQMIFLAKKHHAELLVTTSRRTSPDIEKLLSDVYAENQDVIRKMVLYNKKPEKVIRDYLTLADTVFCTEDSGSMITEAILGKKPLYTIRSDNANPQGVYKPFIEKLIANQYIVSVNIGEISDITFQEPFEVITKKPAEVVYEQLKVLCNTI